MMPNELKDLVSNWCRKMRAERDQFSKFIFGYFCLNAIMSYYSQEEYDFRMIAWLKCNLNVLKTTFHHICSEKEYFLPQLETLYNLSPIKDNRGKNPDVVIKSATDFDSILDAIYRIRCNLFHGTKNPNIERDKQLVILGGRILEKWISSVLPDL